MKGVGKKLPGEIPKVRLPNRLKQRNEELQQENFLLGQRLLTASSKLDTWQKSRDRFEEQTPIKKISNKNEEVDKTQVKLFHPKVYMELEVKGGEPLGRIVFQLYSESAPKVVEEFLQVFTEKAKKKLRINKLFPLLWLEGEIELENLKNLKTDRLLYKSSTLERSADIGVLTFNERFLTEFKGGKLNFSINFQPIRVLTGKRLVFGRTVMGLKLLENIKHFGSSTGIPHKPILIKDFGIVN